MERMFNAYKIRYEKLNEEFLPSRAARSIKRINIYINLDDLYHRIHRPYTELEFQTTGQSVSREIVSNLLNLIAHYKNWAAKEHMQAIIFLLYTTSNVFKNAVRIASYRRYFNQINSSANMDFYHINSAITGGYNILQVMTKYVHNAYAIDTSYLEPSMVPLFLSREYPADFNLFVSRDEYDFQYVTFGNWAIVVPKGDQSTLITKGTLWENVREHNAIREPVQFHPELFIWAKTILGDKYRSIPKLTRTGWKTVIKYLRNTSTEKLNEDAEVLELQLHELMRFIDGKKIQDTDFNNNLYCTSVKEQVDAMLDSDRAIITHQIVDMEDTKALEEVNRTIFRDYPIELSKLLREAPDLSSGYGTHDDYAWRKLLVATAKADRDRVERNGQIE